MKLSLVVLSAGKLEGKSLDIKLAQFVIGRDPQCHLRPASPLISKRHCVILQRDEKAFIRDFDSTNGSFVNDEPVSGETELKNGDRLKIGPLLFQVSIEGVAPASSPTPPPPTRAARPTKAVPGSTPMPPSSGAKKPPATPAGGSKAPTKPATAPAAGPAPTPTPPTTPKPPRPTPAPAPAVSAPAGGDEKSEAEDEIAAMLLSVQDDGTTNLASSDEEVPEGSTVHEMVVPPEVADKLNKNASEKDKEKEKEKPKIAGNTASAAKSILEMYMKRPRS